MPARVRRQPARPRGKPPPDRPRQPQTQRHRTRLPPPTTRREPAARQQHHRSAGRLLTELRPHLAQPPGQQPVHPIDRRHQPLPWTTSPGTLAAPHMQHPVRAHLRVPVPDLEADRLVDPQAQTPPQRRRHVIPRCHQKPPPRRPRQGRPPRLEQALHLTDRRRNTHPHLGQAPGSVELVHRLRHRPARHLLNPTPVPSRDKDVEPVHRLRHLPPRLRPHTPNPGSHQPSIHIHRPDLPHRTSGERQQLTQPRPLLTHPPIRRPPRRQSENELVHPPGVPPAHARGHIRSHHSPRLKPDHRKS